MCTICQAFRPFDKDCDYDGLDTLAPPPGELASIFESGDAPSSTATTATMSVGDTFFGSLSGDTDWIALSVVEGQSYNISMLQSGGGTFDTFLRFYDQNGTYLGYNDDAGVGTNAQATLTATYTGTLYISAAEYAGRSGNYALSVSNATGFTEFNHDQIAYQLTNTYWGGSSRSFNVNAGGTITVDITALTAAGQQLARWAFEAWTAVSGLTFQEVSSGAQINFDDNQSGAFASYTTSGSTILSSNVNVSTAWLTSNGTTIDSYSFQTYMHEIGHALGLGHAGNYNGSAEYGNDNSYLNDSWQQTVMSYFSQSENYNVNASRAFTASLMMADIIAIQNLYGSNVTYNTGNTVYGYNSNVTGYLADLFGQMTGEDTANSALFNGNALAFTLFDTGGIDTIDISGSSAAMNLNLNDETYSDIAGGVGNLAIARGVVIENAIGGSGNDTITGNEANNNIQGGAGTDTFVMDMNRSAATITLLAGGGYQVVSALGTDTLSGVEFIRFNDLTLDLSTITTTGPTAGNDVLTGTASGDTVDLLGGNDSYNGLGGADSVVGGAGNDTLLGGAGNDTLLGGADNDSLVGGDNDDLLVGGSGADTFDGGSGLDTVSYASEGSAVGARLDGGTGWGGAAGDVASNAELLIGSAFNDVLIGNSGNNTLSGGNGDDTFYSDGGADQVNGDAGTDTVSYLYSSSAVGARLDGFAGWGGAAGDTAFGVEVLIGSNFGDVLIGNSGNNTLSGGNGDDTFYGDGGADQVNGDAGTDTLNYHYASSAVGARLDGFAGWGAAAGDTAFGVENLVGSGFGDFLIGSSGNNTISGGNGNDTLFGGAGDDQLSGDAGADTFLFTDGFGNDTIGGFDTAQVGEVIDLSNLSGITDFTDLTTNHLSTDGGGNAVITDGVNTITLTGVAVGSLSSDDFNFV